MEKILKTLIINEISDFCKQYHKYLQLQKPSGAEVEFSIHKTLAMFLLKGGVLQGLLGSFFYFLILSDVEQLTFEGNLANQMRIGLNWLHRLSGNLQSSSLDLIFSLSHSCMHE